MNYKKPILKIISMSMLAIIILTNNLKAQNVPITFEPGGFGATWIWNTFENGPNSPIQIVTNPNTTGINTSSKCASMTALKVFIQVHFLQGHQPLEHLH
jgi:hypothetical protein